MAKKEKEKTQSARPKKAKPVWVVKRRIQEDQRVFMPGDVYDGPNAGALGPQHPWVKAGWLEEQKSDGSDASDTSDKDDLEKTDDPEKTTE